MADDALIYLGIGALVAGAIALLWKRSEDEKAAAALVAAQPPVILSDYAKYLERRARAQELVSPPNLTIPQERIAECREKAVAEISRLELPTGTSEEKVNQILEANYNWCLSGYMF